MPVILFLLEQSHNAMLSRLFRRASGEKGRSPAIC